MIEALQTRRKQRQEEVCQMFVKFFKRSGEAIGLQGPEQLIMMMLKVTMMMIS